MSPNVPTIHKFPVSSQISADSILKKSSVIGGVAKMNILGGDVVMCSAVIFDQISSAHHFASET